MQLEGMISAAVADDGVPLDTVMRPFMERCFGIDFEGVRLHSSAAADAANQALGSLAFAIDDHICFRSGVDSRLGSTFVRILAHELAHVVQKRIGRATREPALADGGDDLLEAEADRIAAEVSCGKRVSRVSADKSHGVRCWGPAGHYWTVYMTAVAAGLEPRTCMNLAFWAQMPDQVKELDATEAGEDYEGEKYALTTIYQNSAWPNNRMLREEEQEAKQKLKEDLVIQLGLHALTGGNDENETKTRVRNLRGCYQGSPDSFEVGLALHAFGDSYAHRAGDGTMYVGPLGHLFHGHDPDLISSHPLQYKAYAMQMYSLFGALHPKAAPRVTGAELLETLGEIAAIKTDQFQGSRMSLQISLWVSARSGGRNDPATAAKFCVFDYDPCDEDKEPCRPWDGPGGFLSRFRTGGNQTPAVTPDLLVRAKTAARQWTSASLVDELS